MNNYMPDNLVKMFCLDCGKNFIVGQDDYNDKFSLNCPFCSGNQTEHVATLEDTDLLGELGCMAIYREE